MVKCMKIIFVVKCGKPGAPLINTVLMLTSNCKNVYTVVNWAS